MAAPLPGPLKTADLQRFAKRAAQLQKYKPIVSYWCEFFLLQQILSKQLHTADDACSNYAVRLMDRLEAIKADNAANDAITDDVAAQAYIENFASETFNRADVAQRANKVSVQTADTFQAASTFIDLLEIWGEVDKEFRAKSKFAKFHAMRILKAIKAGDDPNASNPVVEEPAASAAGDDGIEAELTDLEKEKRVTENQAYQPPTVEDSTDTDMRGREEAGVTESSTAPLPSVPAHTQHSDVSPMEPTAPALPGETSDGGDYFPSMPPDPNGTGETQRSAESIQTSTPGVPPEQLSREQSGNIDEFYRTNAQQQLPVTRPNEPSKTLQTPPAVPQPIASAANPPASIATPVPATHSATHHHATSGVLPPPPGGFKTDDESVMAAQKHARWAISALNFEDANTAVKELRLALNSLGAN